MSYGYLQILHTHTPTDIDNVVISQDLGHAEAVFSLMTGKQISKAAKVAQKSGDHRLALLLAQAGCSHEVRQLVTKQLSDWLEIQVREHVLYYFYIKWKK